MRNDFYLPDMLRREASEWASQPKAKALALLLGFVLLALFTPMLGVIFGLIQPVERSLFYRSPLVLGAGIAGLIATMLGARASRGRSLHGRRVAAFGMVLAAAYGWADLIHRI